MTDGLQYQRFDTAGIHPRERFDYWRTWYSEAVDTPMRLELLADEPKDFRPTAEILAAGDIHIVQVHCDSALGSWRREDMEASDLLRVAIWFKATDVALSWHGHESALFDGSAALYGRTEGWWRAPNGFSAIFVTTPRDSLLLDEVAIDRITARQRPQRSPVFDALIRPMLMGMVGRLRALSQEPADDLSITWQAAINMLMRSLNDERTDGTDLAPAWLLAVRRFINRHLSDPDLDAESVAAALYMSRRSLYELVSARLGEGVAAMIRRQRMEQARALLLDPSNQRRRIGDIATEVGIPSAAQFSRAFRATYGETPRDLRTYARSAATGAISTKSRLSDAR